MPISMPSACWSSAAGLCAAVAEDLERWHPSVVLVDRCDDQSIEPCWSLEAFRVNLVTWFARDPGFKTQWSHYSQRGQIGPFDLWCANADRDACRHLLAALPNRQRDGNSSPVRPSSFAVAGKD